MAAGMEKRMREVDFAVIGSGPAGQKAAITAARLGKSVVVIEGRKSVGGAQINTGTIPSKALREAALHLTGKGRRGVFGECYRVKRHITFQDLIAVSDQVIHNEHALIGQDFDDNNIDLVWGYAKFLDENTLEITGDTGVSEVKAEKILIATGTVPARPESIPFDGEHIFTNDDLLTMGTLPKSLLVVGGGVIGTEYACIMATLGIEVTLLDAGQTILQFMDHEIIETLTYHMRRSGVTADMKLRMGERMSVCEVIKKKGKPSYVQVTTESGKTLKAEKMLYAIGRQGTCSQLGLEGIGLEYNKREKLTVDKTYATTISHIYAAGDVIGFPALASTAMEQGRIAACNAFGEDSHAMPELMPFGIYSVPEMSMVGKTENQLTEEGIPFEAGVAQYNEIARGMLLGDEIGMLKILFHQKDRTILGVHAIGTNATEIIHIGQAVMAFNGKLDFFVYTVFNWPTLAEAYKIAAQNGMQRLN